MRRILFLFIVLLYSSGAIAQYTQNFDNLKYGEYIGIEDAQWTTWSGTTGGTEDAWVDTLQAKSPDNSLYFYSNDPDGGPQDVLLEFGEAYNSGIFEFEHAMFISKNKGAYYNFQGESEPGNIWSMDCYFIDDGKMYVTNQGTEYFETTYPVEKWFVFKLVANLSTNNWEIFIDGVSQGVYSNSVNKIASLDYYPICHESYGGNDIAEFWIDDVSFKHTPYVLPARNAAVLNVAFEQVEIVGVENYVNIEVRNLGKETITSFDLEVSYSGKKYTDKISGLNLDSFESHKLQFATGITIDKNADSLSVRITNVNGKGMDDDTGDDSKMIRFEPIIPAAGKVVIVEEATGAWCGWCPRGAVALAYLERDYHGIAQGIAVHNGDGMTLDVYDQGLGTLISGYPSAMVDRQSDIDPSAIFAPVNERLTTAPAAILENGAKYNATSRKLEVSITAEFSLSANNNWKLACVLTEDGITGYKQSNYYSGGSRGPLVGPDGVDWATLPNPVPAGQVTFDHVARAISPGFGGFDKSFPATVNAGESHTVNFEFDLDPDWEKDKIHIVGILVKPNGKIENGSTSTVDEAVNNGFVEGTHVASVKKLIGPDTRIEVYPNPASRAVFVNTSSVIQKLELVDMTGRVVLLQQNESYESKLDISQVNKGVYILKVHTVAGFYSKRVVVE